MEKQAFTDPVTGKFAVGNPGGGRKASGMQGMSDRIAHWWQTKTGEEIENLLRDAKAYKKLVSIDQAVLMRIREARKKTGIQDMRVLLEYMVGRPVQPIAAEFKHTHGLADRLKKAMQIVDATETQSEDIAIEQISSEEIENVEIKDDKANGD